MIVPSHFSFLATVAMVSIWHMHDWICTTKLDACTIVARGIMICVLCCMHDLSFDEGIATAVVNPRIRVSLQLTNILICFAKHALLQIGGNVHLQGSVLLSS